MSRDKTLPFPWHIDPDDREDMDWNNHILAANGNTVCFMAWSGDPENNEAHEKAAALIVSASMLADAVEALWRATDDITGMKNGAAYDRLVEAKNLAKAALVAAKVRQPIPETAK